MRKRKTTAGLTARLISMTGVLLMSTIRAFANDANESTETSWWTLFWLGCFIAICVLVIWKIKYSKHGEKKKDEDPHHAPKKDGEGEKEGAKKPHAEEHHPKPLPFVVRVLCIVGAITLTGFILLKLFAEMWPEAKAKKTDELMKLFPSQYPHAIIVTKNLVDVDPTILDLEPNVASEWVFVENENRFHSDPGDAIVDLHIVWPDGRDSIYRNRSKKRKVYFELENGMKLQWTCKKKARIKIWQY